MTHTATPRFLIALHIAATLAFCAVAAQMLVMLAAVLGQVHDLCSGLPFVLSLPSGWTPPNVSISGMHELVSYAAFPGGPALLALGFYVAALERAATAGGPPHPIAGSGLPAIGPMASMASAGLWLWALEGVRSSGYALTQGGEVAGLLFAAGAVCLALIVYTHWQEGPAGATRLSG